MPQGCLKRACADTVRSYGLTWGTAIRSIAVPAVTLALIYIYLGKPAAMSGASVWVLAGVSAIGAGFLPLFLWNLWLAPLRIAREEIARQPKPARKADIALYQGLDHYRLDEAACLWCRIEPENPVTEPRAKAMLARLRHDYIDGKIRRYEDDGMHAASVLLGKFVGASPPNSERATAIALRQYAESIGDVPEFLSRK